MYTERDIVDDGYYYNRNIESYLDSIIAFLRCNRPYKIAIVSGLIDEAEVYQGLCHEYEDHNRMPYGDLFIDPLKETLEDLEGTGDSGEPMYCDCGYPVHDYECGF